MKLPKFFSKILRTMNWRKIAKVVVGALLALGVVAAVGAVVGSLGFGPGGILAGTAAASIMSSYGGFVTAGSLCAIAQSIGAIGIPTSKYVSACIAGAMAGLFAGDATSPRL
ncbi:hypothetical protein EC957_012345 [Mortierella hygrophila]|uniref:Uncharacterized protein n=1 Tax=Mortierella hygrophila TaxID=979708 RepID=A0A9P6EU29_9FUNG|nr:hypothetical protein EC957_012345 [Mortierella hygrophila]